MFGTRLFTYSKIEFWTRTESNLCLYLFIVYLMHYTLYISLYGSLMQSLLFVVVEYINLRERCFKLELLVSHFQSLIILLWEQSSIHPLSEALVLWGSCGGWSQSQLTSGRRWATPWRGRHRTTSHAPTGNLDLSIKVHVFGLWVEAEETRDKPLRHWENMFEPTTLQFKIHAIICLKLFTDIHNAHFQTTPVAYPISPIH